MPSTSDTSRRPWNVGRLISPKPPIKSRHIWAIRTRLQHEGRLGIEADDALVMSEQTDI